ncbi:hypothetical protein BCT27_00825 [Enterovibrio norvegicus]|uniref:Uncharacterized protein n=1 Tax=Enterovibrio norvegicus TaxID=188144 RepID=A0A2N7L388_9GAMM|nr:hypothetical protein BCT27_00825 [Enterovibrio norvegicus]PMN87393.1 hypothetical protein BCT23_08535 [Enterovibrio norvegicus]
MKANEWLPNLEESVFSRSYLVTLGGVFISISSFVFTSWGLAELVGLIILLLLALLGLCCLYIGFFASSKRAIAWAMVSKHIFY